LSIYVPMQDTQASARGGRWSRTATGRMCAPAMKRYRQRCRIRNIDHGAGWLRSAIRAQSLLKAAGPVRETDRSYLTLLMLGCAIIAFRKARGPGKSNIIYG